MRLNLFSTSQLWNHWNCFRGPIRTKLNSYEFSRWWYMLFRRLYVHDRSVGTYLSGIYDFTATVGRHRVALFDPKFCCRRILNLTEKFSFSPQLTRVLVYFLGSRGWIHRAIAACRSPCTSRWRHSGGRWRQYCRPDTLGRYRFWESSDRLHELHLRAWDVSKRTIVECKMDFWRRPRWLVLSITPKAMKHESRKSNFANGNRMSFELRNTEEKSFN